MDTHSSPINGSPLTRLVSDTPQATASTRLAHLVGRALTLLEVDRIVARRCLNDAAALLRLDTSATAGSHGNVYRGGLARWQTKRAREYIEQNLTGKLSVRDMARSLGLSNSHFSRAFKSSVGVSPRGYIAQVRIEHAKRMITATSRPLAQIACDCGFADQPHLSKSFQRHVGMSPGRWRRQYGLDAQLSVSTNDP